MTKDTATAAIREMPQEFDVDELIELDDVKKIVSEWRK
jgi:hypothetical protein